MPMLLSLDIFGGNEVWHIACVHVCLMGEGKVSSSVHKGGETQQKNKNNWAEMNKDTCLLTCAVRDMPRWLIQTSLPSMSLLNPPFCSPFPTGLRTLGFSSEVCPWVLGCPQK